MATNNTQIAPQITINQPVHLDRKVSCKLDFNNFVDWSYKVSEIVTSLGLNGYLDGSIAVPLATIPSAAGATENNPNYLNWYMQDQLLLGWLRSTILVPILAQIILPETSAELWSAILQLYSRPPLSRIVELQRKLLQCHRGGLSCSLYLDKMMSVADELASLGAPTSDGDLMSMLSLNLNLGPFYGRFLARYITLKACGQLSLTEFRKLILYYEDLLSLQSEAPKASPNSDLEARRTPTKISKRGSGRRTDNSGHRRSAPCGTSPGPRGRGRGRSFQVRGRSLPIQPSQQASRPTSSPVPLQSQAVPASSSSASNEGCIHDYAPYTRPVNQGSPSSPTS